LDPVLRRRRWIIRRRLEGWKIRDIAEALRINEKTVDRWLSTHRKLGREGLHVRSRRPHHHYKTPQSTVNLILELRRSKHWGPNKIEGYLRNYRLEDITPVSHRTIHRILVEAGLNNPISTPRKVWGKHRFERLHSNNLWQADFKMTDEDEWMISYLDDHSRFIPGLRIHETVRETRPDTDRSRNTIPPSQRRKLRVHRVLQWKQHTTHRRKRQKTLNHRQDRSLP